MSDYEPNISAEFHDQYRDKYVNEQTVLPTAVTVEYSTASYYGVRESNGRAYKLLNDYEKLMSTYDPYVYTLFANFTKSLRLWIKPFVIWAWCNLFVWFAVISFGYSIDFSHYDANTKQFIDPVLSFVPLAHPGLLTLLIFLNVGVFILRWTNVI